LSLIDRRFRLAEEADGLGLECSLTGVFLAGVPLLAKTDAGYAPRAADEIGDLIKAAYGQEAPSANWSPGLAVIAQALNRGDIGRAQVAAVHLRLPLLNWEGASRLARTEEALTKYAPDQPRDWHGRWTDGAGGGPDPSTQPPVGGGADRSGATDQQPSAPPAAAAPSAPSRQPVAANGDGAWAGRVRFYGGKLIYVQSAGSFGGNLPPPEAEIIPEAEPDPNAPSVPEGWDIPVYTDGRTTGATVRVPRLPDGKPWPVATTATVRGSLTGLGRNAAKMTVFVPRDGKGPVLIGSTATFEYIKPEGYSEVEIIGAPQITRSRSTGEETRHADACIDEALEMANSNKFSQIYLNRSFMTSTGRQVQSHLRPDVVGVLRSEIELPERFHPWESLSPGQELPERQEQMPKAPQVGRLRGWPYNSKLPSGERS
jgi:hypothetical protein